MAQPILVKNDGDNTYYLYQNRGDWFVRSKKGYSVESKGGKVIIVEPHGAISSEQITAIAEKVAWMQTLSLPKEPYSKKQK